MGQYKQRLSKLIILFVLVAFISCHKQVKQDIILPSDYKGWFAIVYNCDCGVKKELKLGRIQQEIPNNGILLANYPRNKGALDVRFYKRMPEGKKFIFSIERGDDFNSDSLQLASRLERLSFNGKSTCKPNVKSFYEHDIVYYRFTQQSLPSSPSIDAFQRTLEEYLRLK